MRRLAAIATAAGLLALTAPAVSAAAPVLGVEALRAPATVHANDESVAYTVKLRNDGDEPTVGASTLSVSLPAGLQLAAGAGIDWSCDLGSGSCSYAKPVAIGAAFPALSLLAWVLPGQAPASVDAEFTAAGGGASSVATVTDSFSFAPATPFDIVGLSVGACTAPNGAALARSCAEAEADGAVPFAQAGGHPYAFVNSFDLTTRRRPNGTSTLVEGLRDLFVELPPGAIGNPLAATLCTVTDVLETAPGNEACRETAAVGGASLKVTDAGQVQHQPIYRVVPEDGYVAAFALKPVDVGAAVIVVRVKLRSNGDYGVTAVAPLPPQTPEFTGATYFTFCGYGAKTEMGLWTTGFKGCKKPGTAGSRDIPFLTAQTYCPGSEPVSRAVIDSYVHPATLDSEGFPLLSDPTWKLIETTSPQITGCNQLEFEPSFEGRPTTNVADAPSGLDFDLHIPQAGLLDRDGLAPAHLRDTTVVLPEGMTVNPSAATGLEACTSAQIGLVTAVGQAPARFSGFPARCPDASKLGTVEVRTPLLDKPLSGSVYLAKQYDNPFDSLLALYIAISDPETGVVVKLAGQVTPDPVTGRLSTTFAENPQLPFEDLELRIFNGARASLRTPPTCGTKTTSATFTPWSAPESGPPAQLEDSFETTAAPTAGPCPTEAGALPHAPRFSAGTVVPKAGAYSPFVLRLSREDGSRELNGLDVTLPPGLTGRLAGVPYCSEAQIAQAIGRGEPGEGAIEQAHPACPAASEVGVVDVTAGAGPLPFHATGRAYLAGPYKGAPLSMVVVTPAVAGPFDLGTVVVRNALHVDPVTTQVSVKSDPIPTILEGIPLDVRSIAVSVSRDRFTLNPTSCSPKAIAAAAFAIGSRAALSDRFQVGECSSLGFKPKLALKLKGGTQRGDHPALVATLTPRPGDANLASISVALPHSAFLEQAHIKTICTRVQFAAHACPAAAVYGHVEATSPLLDTPLRGPVYLRSSDHPLPDLVMSLHGPASQPIEVNAAGRIDSVHGGIRNSFEQVPDAPVTQLVLRMPGGKKGLLVNSRDLCAGRKQRATVRITAQNGKRFDPRPVLRTPCKKKGKKQEKRKAHGSR